MDEFLKQVYKLPELLESIMEHDPCYDENITQEELSYKTHEIYKIMSLIIKHRINEMEEKIGYDK